MLTFYFYMSTLYEVDILQQINGIIQSPDYRICTRATLKNYNTLRVLQQSLIMIVASVL